MHKINYCYTEKTDMLKYYKVSVKINENVASSEVAGTVGPISNSETKKIIATMTISMKWWQSAHQ